MSDTEILTKAIEKAIAGGWNAEMLGGKDDWSEFSEFERQHVVNMMVNYKIGDGYRMLIFNHEFAKALWGEEPILEYSHVRKDAVGSLMPPYEIPMWQYDLQQMVIAEDPIKYLGENILII